MSEPLLRRLIDTVLPPVCPVTGDLLDRLGTIAPAAWTDLALLTGEARCGFCGREIPGAVPAEGLTCEPCTASPRPWSRGAAAMRYQGTGRALVLALKRGDKLHLAPLLADWMHRARPELAEEADLILPVPLHWRRMLARRSNQSAEIARALCRRIGRREAYAPRLLRRIRPTPSQGGLDRAARAANMVDAFALARGATTQIAGKRLLLVDDVMTTGATLAACTELCLAGGAAAVDVLVSALVSFDDPPYLAKAETKEPSYADD